MNYKQEAENYKLLAEDKEQSNAELQMKLEYETQRFEENKKQVIVIAVMQILIWFSFSWRVNVNFIEVKTKLFR